MLLISNKLDLHVTWRIGIGRGEDKESFRMKLQLSTANITYEVAPLGTIFLEFRNVRPISIMKRGETNCHSVQSTWKFPQFF